MGVMLNYICIYTCSILKSPISYTSAQYMDTENNETHLLK